MTIEWLRDLSICILGLGVTAVAIFIGVIIFLLYYKLKPVLDSLKTTTRAVENISTCVEEEVARPIAQVAAFLQGIAQAVGMVHKFTSKKEGKKNV